MYWFWSFQYENLTILFINISKVWITLIWTQKPLYVPINQFKYMIDSNLMKILFLFCDIKHLWHHQAIALVDIVKSFNWTYISTVYSEGSYGKYLIIFEQSTVFYEGCAIKLYIDKLTCAWCYKVLRVHCSVIHIYYQYNQYAVTLLLNRETQCDINLEGKSIFM